MSKPALPQTGGSYTRESDGSLTRIPVAPPAKKPGPKPAKKEDS